MRLVRHCARASTVCVCARAAHACWRRALCGFSIETTGGGRRRGGGKGGKEREGGGEYARVPYSRYSPYMTMMVVKRRNELNMGTFKYLSAITPDMP